jgi:hypothetical protein
MPPPRRFLLTFVNLCSLAARITLVTPRVQVSPVFCGRTVPGFAALNEHTHATDFKLVSS